MTKANELVKARQVEKNIAATIESLANCLPVLQTFSKLSRQMREKRYHPALKTLEQLENTHLPKISHCRFASKMKDQIPKLRTSIKEASMRELKDFLENIRKYSPKIGEIAMRHTAEKSNVDPTIVSSPDAQRFMLMTPQVYNLGIQIRNMKMVFNFNCTWRWVTFEKLMMKIDDFFYSA